MHAHRQGVRAADGLARVILSFIVSHECQTLKDSSATVKQTEDLIAHVKQLHSTGLDVDVSAAQKWLAVRYEGQKLRDHMRALLPKPNDSPSEQTVAALESAIAALVAFPDASLFAADLLDAKNAAEGSGVPHFLSPFILMLMQYSITSGAHRPSCTHCSVMLSRPYPV